MPRTLAFTLSFVALAAALPLVVGCSAAAEPAEEPAGADEGALETAGAGTILKTESASGGLSITFGATADKKTPIAKVTRGRKSRTLKCESFINLEESGRPALAPSITCTEAVPGREGYDWCEIQVRRTAADRFSMDASCTDSSGNPEMADQLKKTYEVLAGEAVKAHETDADKRGVELVEVRKAAGPFEDMIALTEALVAPLTELLTKKALVKTFRTGAVEDMELTRVAAHPNFGARGTQLVAFATSYSAHVEIVSAEGAPGTLAPSSEIVSRVLSVARCTSPGGSTPTCLH